MDRRATQAKRVTSLTWGPPPPCKQALSYFLSWGQYNKTFKSENIYLSSYYFEL